jgi:hypothetical protein
MRGIKKIADFEDRFFKIAKGKSEELLKGDIKKELESGEDFPVSLKADFGLLINEINALARTRNLIEGIIEELKSDFDNLLKSKDYDDFIDNFKDLVEIEQMKRLPDVLRGIIQMEIGLALSFITVINNLKDLQMKDYEDSFNQYFFSGNGYKTVSGDLIIRPKFPKIGSLADIKGIGNQINAERYIRDMTRIVVETTGDRLYNLRDRYMEFTGKYQDKKKLIEWFDSFGDMAEASILPVVEGIIHGAFNIELNPLVAAAIGTFCSVNTRKATEHAYLTLVGIP